MTYKLTQKDYDTLKVGSLQDHEEGYLEFSDGSGALIKKSGNNLYLYEISQYGGEPIFANSFSVEDYAKLVDLVYSWT